MHKLNILIIGGTGFIGSTLSSILLAAGHSVSVLSRNIAPTSFHRNSIAIFQADVSKPGVWQDRNIVDTIRKERGNIKQFFSISGVGYYGFHGDELIDENIPAGSDFIAQVAAKWEATAQKVKETGIRIVIRRLGHVLGMHGGALPKLVTLTRLHLGSYWGSGNQWVSWIHEKDLARSILFLINTPTVSGPVNITSPNPVRNREMMKILTKTIGRRVYIPPMPKFALHFMLGQFSSVFVNGQKVIPAVLQQKEFVFKFPSLDEALSDLLKTHR